MKKTIYLLISIASLNVAFAQGGLVVYQGNNPNDAASVGNKANITQVGGVYAANYQGGVDGQTTITQTTQEINDNSLLLSQVGNVNDATVNQSGQRNSLYIEQINGAVGLVGGNVLSVTQSGSNNVISIAQTAGTSPESPVYGNHVSITQTADNGLIEIYQTGTKGGNNAFVTQESDNSIVRVIENGAYNTANITQTAGAYNNVYLELDNSAAVTSIGNNASILQSGTGNIFQVKFIGDNNKINVEQIGNNNLLTDAYNSYGIGSLRGSNNTVNAIQHGDNLSGFLNLDANNSTINVLSVAY